ncbi:11246_t:CDS:2, partial [Ambispora gerdemannii]
MSPKPGATRDQGKQNKQNTLIKFGIYLRMRSLIPEPRPEDTYVFDIIRIPPKEERVQEKTYNDDHDICPTIALSESGASNSLQ